jgi:hypothetical protein
MISFNAWRSPVPCNACMMKSMISFKPAFGPGRARPSAVRGAVPVTICHVNAVPRLTAKERVSTMR